MLPWLYTSLKYLFIQILSFLSILFFNQLVLLLLSIAPSLRRPLNGSVELDQEEKYLTMNFLELFKTRLIFGVDQ